MGERSDDEENWMVLLRKAVKRLHFGRWEEKEEAAEDIRRLAKEEDIKRRKLMVELGVIQPLVDMLASDPPRTQMVALQALNHVTSASLTNKAIMVGAGIMSKLPKKVDSLDESTKQEYAHLLLHLTALATSGFPLTSSTIMIHLAVRILDSTTSTTTINLCLSTLHNLSLGLDNVGGLVTCGAVHSVLRVCSSKESSEIALSILGNLAVTVMGKKALENNVMVANTLIEILTWEENPKCQELSAYILMSLAHQSSTQRDKMAKSGIVPVLLEVALLGSPLAQKRALKLLQWFKEERRVRMGPHSGPQEGRIMSTYSLGSIQEVGEGKKLMKNIVKHSLHKNMERITSRANGLGDSYSFKSLVATSSSKSLPY
ncbi:hypothetical protein LIER_17421 [Lithospermum erythrorhizon]|uniref:U-box domain-containing protein n=1 Tax=Lithospermum erythrorhizon TaxID=34254 RepID=A0AAV3QDI2_LITER